MVMGQKLPNILKCTFFLRHQVVFASYVYAIQLLGVPDNEKGWDQTPEACNKLIRVRIRKLCVI